MVMDDFDDQMLAGDECRLNFLTLVMQLRKSLNQEIYQTGDRTRDCWVSGNNVIPGSQRWSLFFFCNLINNLLEYYVSKMYSMCIGLIKVIGLQ